MNEQNERTPRPSIDRSARSYVCRSDRSSVHPPIRPPIDTSTHRSVDSSTRRRAQIEERFNIAKVRLVNDFVAAGYGLLTLDVDTECITLQVRGVGVLTSCRSCMAVVVWPLILSSLQCRDEARRFITDQAEVALNAKCRQVRQARGGRETRASRRNPGG